MTATLFDLPTSTAALDEVPDFEPSSTLTDLQREVLEMEATFPYWFAAGSKEDAVLQLLDLTPSRYYQLLNQCLDVREALELQPTLVYRLRRLREHRSLNRVGRRARLAEILPDGGAW